MCHFCCTVINMLVKTAGCQEIGTISEGDTKTYKNKYSKVRGHCVSAQQERLEKWCRDGTDAVFCPLVIRCLSRLVLHAVQILENQSTKSKIPHFINIGTLKPRLHQMSFLPWDAFQAFLLSVFISDQNALLGWHQVTDFVTAKKSHFFALTKSAFIVCLRSLYTKTLKCALISLQHLSGSEKKGII